MRAAIRTVATAVILALGASPGGPAALRAAAPEDLPPAQLSPVAEDFLVGNTIFILFHEFGHALIREFEVPLLGLEEDSADTIAAITLLSLDRAYPEARPRMAQYLAMAALGNMLTWTSGKEKGNSDLVLWSQHSLSIQRFARSLCLLYGSNTREFQWVVDESKMPEIRADWCEDEYGEAQRGVEWLVSRYGTRQTLPAQRNGRISVVYGNPRNPMQEAGQQFLKKRQIFERAARFLESEFRFPRPFAIRVKGCREPNAYWDPEARELLFCYEMLEWLLQLSASPAVARVDAAFAAQNRDDAPHADDVR